MNTHRLTTRGKKMIAVAVAGVTIGVGGALVAAAGSPSDDSRTIDPALIEYATEHQLTGQSPASLHAATVRDAVAAAYADMDDIAAYARENGLTGLSPASLQPLTSQP
jgi:hypothetical protein